MARWNKVARQKQSQLIRQWKPWQKSTGAKTEEGKTTSKMNAYKHGGRCADVRELHATMMAQKKALNDIVKLI